MKIRTLLLAILLLGVTTLFSAPFKNVKKILKQPDGTELHCFATGDEFYNRLHDADGFTIIQSAKSGFFVYADTDARGNIIETEYIAGVSDPKALGLKPNIMISQEEYHRRRETKMAYVNVNNYRDGGILNHGNYNNLVVFIKFKGDADFGTTTSKLEEMFNNGGRYDVSMNNYFKNMTYNQLSMDSYYYPIPEGDKVLAYEDIYPRNYYQPYNPTTNPEGYTNQAEREFPLLKRAIESIADQVPDTLNIDRDNDGYIDNVIFVVKGNVGDWSDLLWPHMWSMYGEEAYINGKRVGTFNFQLETSSYFSVSTLCHEMSHSLGLPDLYHYKSNQDHLSPSGPWDLMCGNANPPQHTSTYMKYKYGTWIDEIPEITEYGTYTIEANSWQGGRRNCYKIATDSPHQYYLLEYRNESNFFETGLPSGGLLIYRIDTRFHGCADYNGYDTFDEVYIFRPGGSQNQNGVINNATFAKDWNRTEFNINTDPYPFLNKGQDDLEFNICNISEIGDQMTFTYCPADTEIVPKNLKINVNNNDKVVELKWDANEFAESYNIYRNGELLTSNVTEVNYKDAYAADMSTCYEYYVTANSSGTESYRSNEEIVYVGDYSEYTVKMTSNDEYGWIGGEVKVSFDNGMEDKYFTMYAIGESERSFIVPKGTQVTLSWTSGWDDLVCSFVVTENEETIYASSDLEEGVFAEFVASGNSLCVTPINLTAVILGNNVSLDWYSIVEAESYAIVRNGEVIAENVMTNTYVDTEIPSSGMYEYSVKSMTSTCMSEPSNEVAVSVFKVGYSDIAVEYEVKDDTVVLDWKQPEATDSQMKYGNDEYLLNEGSASHNWGIKIPAENLKLFKNMDVSSVEIFDACAADYTFKIYSGEIPHDSILLYEEKFTTTNSNQFVKFDLSEKVPFTNEKDLWITVKASKAKAIPCGEFCGDPNSNLIKAGSIWKSAIEYKLNYSWLLSAYTSSSEGLNNDIRYNVYRDETLIASELDTLSFTDNNITEEVCYKVEATINGNVISSSEQVCVEPEHPNPASLPDGIFPNPTNDYIYVNMKDVVNVTIYNVLGATVFSQDANSQSFKIDMRNFESGTYIIQITTKTEIIKEKIVLAF